jgi:hypothetical protein
VPEKKQESFSDKVFLTICCVAAVWAMAWTTVQIDAQDKILTKTIAMDRAECSKIYKFLNDQ